MEHYTNLISTLPIGWQIFINIILVIGYLILFFKKHLIKTKIWKKLIGENNKINLNDHKLFTESSYLIHKINSIDVGSDKKNNVFRGLLLIKYESIISNSNLLINNKTIYDLSNSQLYSIILDNMTEIIENYNDKIKLKYGDDIYKLVMMNKEKGFNILHEKTVFFIKSAIEESFKPEHIIYITTEEKIDFLFDMYFIAMKMAMSDVDKLYKNFNGDLDLLLKECNHC